MGPRGEPAPTITGWRVDRAAYAAVPLLSDGNEGAPLEFQAISRRGIAVSLDERSLIAVRFCPDIIAKVF
jgi:hypothetical protein